MNAPPSPGYLAVYGSLAPRQRNHGQLRGIHGRWFRGEVEGDLRDRGGGAAGGFPGLTPRPGGPRVAVSVLESCELAEAWERLDAFEGDEYRRVQVPVFLENGETICAHVYALRSVT
jgi:gamma-glutamylcyclotransferase (GGCT)/AIG2-like uncharacterized protein YtfP